MKLHTLKRSTGLKDKAKRIGRGNGSGKGNYSTKGLKGQKARSGFGMKPFFEGGQTSIVQRIPKAKGFKRYFKLIQERQIVNLGALDLDTRIVDGTEITKTVLFELGYIKDILGLVKILGNGHFSKKITFAGMDKFSSAASKKIENPSAASDKPVAKKADLPVKKTAVKKAVKTEETTEKVEKVAKAPAKKAAVKTEEKVEKVAKAPAKKAAAKK